MKMNDCFFVGVVFPAPPSLPLSSDTILLRRLQGNETF